MCPGSRSGGGCSKRSFGPQRLGKSHRGEVLGTHTLKHSFARHMLLNGIPLNYLSRWLGHGQIQTTLVYLELAPDPPGSLASVP